MARFGLVACVAWEAEWLDAHHNLSPQTVSVWAGDGGDGGEAHLAKDGEG